MLVVSISACTANKPRPKAAKQSADRSSSKKINLEEQSRFDNRLKEAIMPAIDVIHQVKDTAVGVVSGKTKADLATAIYAGADRFLIETRVKISELSPPNGRNKIRERADELITKSADVLTDLNDATKNKDIVKLKTLIPQIEETLEQLREIVGTDNDRKTK